MTAHNAPGSARRRSALNHAAQRLEMRLAAARRSSQSPTSDTTREDA